MHGLGGQGRGSAGACRALGALRALLGFLALEHLAGELTRLEHGAVRGGAIGACLRVLDLEGRGRSGRLALLGWRRMEGWRRGVPSSGDW